MNPLTSLPLLWLLPPFPDLAWSLSCWSQTPSTLFQFQNKLHFFNFIFKPCSLSLSNTVRMCDKCSSGDALRMMMSSKYGMAKSSNPSSTMFINSMTTGGAPDKPRASQGTQRALCDTRKQFSSCLPHPSRLGGILILDPMWQSTGLSLAWPRYHLSQAVGAKWVWWSYSTV